MNAGLSALAAVTRRPEAECVAALAQDLRQGLPDRAAVAAHARALVTVVRAQRRQASGVDLLMQEFSLSSDEGVALMCLAEALLRIPDRRTVDALIRDKIGGANWADHLGHSGSLFVNAAAWGLLITGRLVDRQGERRLGTALGSLLARCGEPLIRRGMEFAMQLLGEQFVLGQDIAQALARGAAREGSGFTHSFDMLGEAALTAEAAEQYTQAYRAAIEAIGQVSAGRGPFAGPGISVKLSALHPRYSSLQRERVHGELYPRLLALAECAAGFDIGLNIDAEESERLELSLELVARLLQEPTLAAWQGLGVVVQAYQKRASAAIDWLIGLARQQQRRIMIRLVKGAYWDSEIKRAQTEGLADYPVFTRKAHADLSYLACARQLLAAGDTVYAQFATHNAHTVAFVHQLALAAGVQHYEFQCLHGMGETLYGALLAEPGFAQRCRIYAPVGDHRTLLPYLVRRLLENGANSSFVNQLVDPAVSVETLIRDPLDRLAESGGAPHPGVPLPARIFPDGRRNSRGRDLHCAAEQAAFAEALQRHWPAGLAAGPLIATAVAGAEALAGQAVRNPARQTEQIGAWRPSSSAEIDSALAAAEAARPVWAGTAGSARAALLRACGDALEAAEDELMALCVAETGKTWANAVAEVREAVDFCRYYAGQAQACEDGCGDGGVTLCISPWNFPLAILAGQITGALAAGRTVIAKPAEQSTLVAWRAVQLFHAAGVPRQVLQLLPGRGETVGAALVADARITQVLFTGSTQVARQIQSSLLARAGAGPAATLVAETGGQNCMVVDSSALLEQAAQDILTSAFDSAGQRCSALRVLYLQEEIAGPMLALLKSAMRELQIGDPARPGTDVGPLIDPEARAAVERHIDRLRSAGARVFQVEAGATDTAGCFVAPTLIELDAVALPDEECFGPVLHVLPYASEDLGQCIARINAGGYGLTFGMHSRIDERIALACQGIRAGNVYINRNMVGAVVGVQPFGGEGKSGTGPKAGGPLFVRHLQGARVTPAWLARCGSTAQPAEAVPAHPAVRPVDGRDSLLGLRLALPGPTGERNEMAFHARGMVLCVAGSTAALQAQQSAVLACGGEVRVAGPELSGGDPLALPEGAMRFVEQDWPQVRAVLFDAPATALATVRRQIAALPQGIVPLLQPQGDERRYALHLLVREQVVSVNTAAAGGNASLMMLAG